MIRVFLVDDHEIVRRGIAELIDAEPDIEVVGEAGTVAQARTRIAATLPDVAVLDVRLPDGNGIDLCRSVRSEQPSVRCLMLTAYADDEASYAAVLAGADGYVLKDIRGHHLVDGIRRVAAARSLLPRGTGDRVVQALSDRGSGDGRAGGAAGDPDAPELTLRERQILSAIAEGLTNRQIGDRLGIAEKTVKNYVSGLFAKLGVERRTQAAVYGAKHRAP